MTISSSAAAAASSFPKIK